MHLIVEHNGRSFFSETIASLSVFQVPFSEPAFPCLLWDHAGGVPAITKTALARTLLQAGCCYAVCAGYDCEEWHDAFDLVHVEDHLDSSADENEDTLVMTTWHDGETPDDVAFFFVLNTNFGHHDFERFLVLHVGTGPQRPEVDERVRRHALG